MSLTDMDLRMMDEALTMSTATIVEALGMHWENVARQQNDEAPAYKEKEFNGLLERNGIHWNASVGRWQR